MVANASARSRIKLPMKQIEEFCHKYGVEEFSLFGSVLRDDIGPDSDVDVMLKFKQGFGFTFENTPDIYDELETMFARPVDVIEKGKIRNPFRRHAIMTSYRVVYAA
jgi:predicted nucleotidyltransferase